MGLWVAGREQSGAGGGYRSENGRPRGGASSLCPFLLLHPWRVVSPPALIPPGSALPTQCFLGTDLSHPSPHTPCPRLHWALQRLLTRLGPRPPGVHSEATASGLPSRQAQDSDLCLLLLLPIRPPPFSPSSASWRRPPLHLACPSHCSTTPTHLAGSHLAVSASLSGMADPCIHSGYLTPCVVGWRHLRLNLPKAELPASSRSPTLGLPICQNCVIPWLLRPGAPWLPCREGVDVLPTSSWGWWLGEHRAPISAPCVHGGVMGSLLTAAWDSKALWVGGATGGWVTPA